MSIVWTLAIAAIALAAGVIASSIALIGLGLESVIDLLVAAIVIWQLLSLKVDGETRSLRLIGLAFLASAAYLSVESIRELVSQSRSEHPPLDLAVAAAALVVMPLLALGKRRVGRAIGSRTLIADAFESNTNGASAAAALLGIGLDAWLGWWWTVPTAALFIAAVASAEAIRIERHLR